MTLYLSMFVSGSRESHFLFSRLSILSFSDNSMTKQDDLFNKLASAACIVQAKVLLTVVNKISVFYLLIIYSALHLYTIQSHYYEGTKNCIFLGYNTFYLSRIRVCCLDTIQYLV